MSLMIEQLFYETRAIISIFEGVNKSKFSNKISQNGIVEKSADVYLFGTMGPLDRNVWPQLINYFQKYSLVRQQLPVIKFSRRYIAAERGYRFLPRFHIIISAEFMKEAVACKRQSQSKFAPFDGI